MARRLEVQIVGDASSLERAFDRANKSTAKFERNMSRAGRGGLAASGVFQKMGRAVSFASPQFLTGAGAVAGLEKVISAASDMNEEIGKTQVVFGAAAASVQDWSKTTTQAFGLSQRQALETASSFGALFQPLGIIGQQAEQQSEKLTQLGADLASFYNTDVQSALDAIKSGLVGESEPLRRYGVLLSESRVQQEAMNETGKRVASQLTDQEKVLARITLIMDDSKQAQGDFARSSGRLAGQMKTLQGNIDDLAVALGQRLIPAATNATTVLNYLAGAANKGADGQGFLGRVVHGAAEEMKKQIPALEVLSTATKQFGDNSKEAAAQAAGVTAAVAAMGQAINAVATLTQGIRPGNIMPGTEFQGARGINITTEQRNQFRDRRLQRMLDRVQDIPTLKGRIARLREIGGLVQQWIDATKDVTRKQTLQDQLLGTQRDILSDQAQITQDAADAAERAKRKHEELLRKQKELAEKRREALVARQFGILGLGPTGEDPIPGMRALRRQLQRVASRLKGTELDTRGNRSLLQRIRKALDFKTLEPEVRQKIRDLLKGIQDEFQQGSEHILRFRRFQPDAFINRLGLNLSPAQRRRLREGLAGIGPHGTVASPTSAFALAGGVTFNGPVTFNGVQDVKQMEHQLARRGKARSHQRRGAR